MTILNFNDIGQLLPINQIVPTNPGSYNNFVASNNLDPNKDNLRKYTRALTEYHLGIMAIQKDINSDIILL